MTREELGLIIATLSPVQLLALRICIMAERRLRVIYPRTTASEPAFTEAYEWALKASADQVRAVELPR